MYFDRFLFVASMLWLVFSSQGYPRISASTLEKYEDMGVVDESATARAIAAAEERIGECYEAVADADKVGANTKSLLAILNEAGTSLSKAKWANKRGDFESASYFALLCLEQLSGFVAAVDLLQETAIQQRNWDFMVNVVGSIAGTLLVICCSIVVWIFSKKKYKLGE